jgi:tetratricopeptide (TPR) repeat protein
LINQVRIWLVIVLAFATSGGCAFNKSSLHTEIDQALVLENIPFYPQKDYQCGPAALAMLLGASGVTVHPDDLTPYTYIPERKGSFQVELLAASRLHKRIPYVIDPDISALSSELKAGRPVLVLQNLALHNLPAYHYAVVIGLLPPDKIVLHSGEKRRLTTDLEKFLSRWKRAGAWGLIALKPGEIPAVPDRIRYLTAVSAFESSGNIQQAEMAYHAACSTWPEDQTALLALGNNYLSQGNYQEAETIFEELISINPNNFAASNNLAEVLSRRGCYSQALIVIDRTVKALGKVSSSLNDSVNQTRSEILQYLNKAAADQDKKCADL